MSAALAYQYEDAPGWAGPLLVAALLHVLVLGLVLLADIDWRKPARPQATGLNLDTRLVDVSQYRQRLQQTAAQQQQRAREQQAAQLRAEQAAARERALQQQQQREQAARERQQQLQAQAEQQRQAEAEREAREQAEQQRRDQADRERQQALEAQLQREAERRRRELEALRQREQDQQRRQDERLQQELQQLRQQREALARQSAAAEQQLSELDAAEVEQPVAASNEAPQADAPPGNGVLGSLRDEYIASIAAAVRAAWVRPPTAQDSIECRVAVLQIPGGEVIEASIASPCNADAATRRSIVAAVRRNDLPYQGFEDVFERRINFTFTDK